VTAKLKSIQKPIQLAELAYEALRDSILSGHLKPGDIVNEIPMAKEMGISRTPVREALLELSSQGLVEIIPRRGIRIKYFTEKDVHEVCEIRELIELGIVEKVAQSGAAFPLGKLEQVLEKQREAMRSGDVPEFLHADRLFHLELVSLSANRRLPKILVNLRDLIDVMAQRALTRAGRPEEVLAEHQEVVDCIKLGKAAEAKDALRLHLEKSKQAVIDRIKRDSQNSNEETSYP
jgi:DNA-binding GntR family transcriptional regulator